MAAVARIVLMSLRGGGGGGGGVTVRGQSLGVTVRGQSPGVTVRGGITSCVCLKSTYPYSALSNEYNCKVELALTPDRKTVVCYHPSVDILYEHTKPIPRLSPVENKAENHEQVLKARLAKGELRNKPAPTIEELSKMFYTTKHRWFPIGLYRRRKIKANPPKDR